MEPDPNPLAAALGMQDAESLTSLLRENQVGLMVIEAEGNDVPQVLTDDAGNRVLGVFTGADTFSRWDRSERLAFVAAADLPEIAKRQEAAVLMDPAGPHPSRFSAEQLQALLDGITTSSEGQVIDDEMRLRLPSDPEEVKGVVAAVRAAGAGNLELFLLERLVSNRGILTLLASGPRLEVAALAHGLSGDSRITMVDVVAVPPEKRDLIADRFPDSRVIASEPKN